MGLLERSIFKNIMLVFFSVLGVLSGVVWMTQALRELDLMTAQGQTIGLFFFITALSLPLLVLVIAPVALMIAFIVVLNRMNADSELVVMNASGMSPSMLFKPFALAALCISLLIAAMSLYLSPEAQRILRITITEVRADLISTVIKDNNFVELDDGLTFHVRQRLPGGLLNGIMASDRRDPEAEIVYLAEQGKIVEIRENTFLVMQKGVIQQKPRLKDGSWGEITSVDFDQYALDLSRFNQVGDISFFKPRERSTFYLLNPDPEDEFLVKRPGQFKTELHDRLTAPLYAFAFMALTLAFLGQARTNRQSRTMAVVIAIVASAGVRLAGFAILSLTIKFPDFLPLLYLVPVGVTTLALYAFLTQKTLFLPTFISDKIIFVVHLFKRGLMFLMRRLSGATRPLHRGSK
jgi:lipopolysaccharide export system permease protein